MKKKDLERYAITGIKERINAYIDEKALFLWCKSDGKRLCHEDYYDQSDAVVPCAKIFIPSNASSPTSSAIILTIVNAPLKKPGDDDNGCKDSWLRMELVMALKKPAEQRKGVAGKDIPEDTKNSLAALREAFLAFASVAWGNRDRIRKEFNNVITEGQTPSQSFELLTTKELPALKIKVSCTDEKKGLYRGSVVAFFEGLTEFIKYLEDLELAMTVASKAGLLTELSKKDKNKYF